ncbi:MAG: alkaline phosphatase family protein [Planctomycetales bacterium]|nr:alkaline phosphatase family protein [Planctomycetales bacterium]
MADHQAVTLFIEWPLNGIDDNNPQDKSGSPMTTNVVLSKAENSPRLFKHRGRLRFRGLILGLMLSLWLSVAGVQAQTAKVRIAPALRTRNVILITVDGLRWQEVFGGVDVTLMDKDAGGIKDLPALTQRFQRETARESREALMPFFWRTLAQQGVVFGDPEQESKAVVTNGLNFSYPGYSEILCGFADPLIDSNAKKDNVNVTVLEWLKQKPGFENSVAAFCSWDVFPFIINETRSGIPVNAGWEPLTPDASLNLEGSEAVAALRELDEFSLEIPRYFPDVRYDFVTFRGAAEFLKAKQPRLIYVSLGETDDWAHAGRYDLYLDAAFRTDDYIRRLWQQLQSMPEYRDSTTLILTTDHGRGDNRIEWKNHGEKVDDCEYIWMAVMGPDTPHQLIRGTTVTQSQIAATVAACLGHDYQTAVPRAAAPLPVLP